MFTGLVEEIGAVKELKKGDKSRPLKKSQNI